jgi:hypothetical protein
MRPDEYPLTAAELARRLKVDGKQLRHAIREHDLVPGHDKGAHYAIDREPERRIAAHPAVAALRRR